MYVQWAKCAGDWCAFDTVDLANLHGQGVYIIWKPNGDVLRPSVVVRVGHGDIAARLASHRIQQRIMRHGPGLLVTWTALQAGQAAGVALYLNRLLRPLVREPHPADVTPISANLPISA